MKCQSCQGARVTVTYKSAFEAGATGLRYEPGVVVRFDAPTNRYEITRPCAECGGNGQAHCCDGLQSQPEARA